MILSGGSAIEYNELISYILAQLVGAALAVKFLGYIPKVF
jgi:glycerol uptake facilitator-like aquaporin